MKVTISERAERNLDNIVRYLETQWSARVRDKFLDLLKNKIEKIAKMPQMYEASSKKKTIRRCVLNKQTSLYYRVRRDELEIVTIQDNRKNPKKIKL
jgi:plasmid stabilization system protein ParE